MNRALHKLIIWTGFFALGVLYLTPYFANAQISNATYELEGSVVSAGGGTSTNSTYDLDFSVGETFIGNIANTAYEVFVGFLKPTTACSDGLDNDGDGLVDLLDNGCTDSDDENEYLVSGGGGGGGGGGDPPPDQSCSITAEPSSITSGDSSLLSWSGNSLALSGHSISGIGAVGNSGSWSVTPTTTANYIGLFSGANGEVVSCSKVVNVVSPNSGKISFYPDVYQISEASNKVLLLVERSDGQAGPSNVDVVVLESEIAQIGVDYNYSNTTLNWLDGESGFKAIEVEILDDDLLEGPEFITFALSDLTGAAYGSSITATLQILDNDQVTLDPVVTLISTVNNVGVGVRSADSFDFYLNEVAMDSGQTITVGPGVPLEIRSSDAKDYIISSITGSPECPTSLEEVFILEENESIVCRINYLYVGGIDEPEPEPEPEPGPEVKLPESYSGGQSEVSLLRKSMTIMEIEGQVIVSVNREGALTLPVEAMISVLSGSAQLGSDYSPGKGLVQWAAGEGGAKTVLIEIIADGIPEVDEYFTVALSSVSSGGFGELTRSVITIQDEQPKQFMAPVEETVLDEFFESDSGRTAVVVSAVASAAVLAATAMIALAANPGAIAEILTLPLRLWSLLWSFFGIRRKHQPWGVVYDSITKQPLDPAYVIMRDEMGKEIGTSITDLNGRYGFLVKAGTYSLEAAKTNYVFPSRKLWGKSKDELYSRLYFGGPVTIKRDGEVILYNIPMDQVGDDWNQKAKVAMKLNRFYNKHSRAIAIFSDLLFYIGVALTAVATIVAPEKYNIIILSAYGLLMILRMIGLKVKGFGRVVEGKTGNPVPNVVLKFISEKTGVQVAKRTTDSMGRYYALIYKGKYRVEIESQSTEGQAIQLGLFHNIKTRKGIIRKFFKV